jgi:hypothetical protein
LISGSGAIIAGSNRPLEDGSCQADYFPDAGGTLGYGLDRSTDPLAKGLDGEAGLVQIGGESPTSCPRYQGNSLKAIDLHHRYS